MTLSLGGFTGACFETYECSFATVADIGLFFFATFAKNVVTV